MFSSPTETTLNRQQLYRITKRILNSNSLHFIPISILFLPFAFSASTVFESSFSSKDFTTMFDPFNLFLIKTIPTSSQNLLTVKTLVTLLTFICFVILPTMFAVALITCSTNHIIYHKRLTFSSTLKSLSHSCIPLLHTLIAGSIILIILFIIFTLSPVVVTETVKALGLGFDFDPVFLSTFVNLIVSFALAMAILYFIVILGSAAAITVLESKSGFESLRQSANQSTEFRRQSFSIVYIAGFVGASTPAYYSTVLQYSGPAAKWISILHIGTICLLSSLMILLCVAANTVLYVQCKEMVEEELAGEDVRLVMNDDDGEANGGFNYMCYLLCTVWLILLCVQFTTYLFNKIYSE